MGYFVDSNLQVVITQPGEPAPAACRIIPHDVATPLGLRAGQQLSAEGADLLVDGRLQTYLALLPPDQGLRVQAAIDDDRQLPLNTRGMLLVTTPTLPGWRIEKVFGAVVGNTVRTRNTFSRLGAALSANFGGELTAFTELLTSSRNEAVGRMVGEARALGANAVVGVFFATSELLEIATEALVFGTAVYATQE